MEIIFVRHAEKEKEGEDPDLTKKGLKQAKALAKKLKKFKIDEIYCSNLNRSRQTAEVVSKKLKLKLKIKKELREYNWHILWKEKKNFKKDELKQLKELNSFLEKLSKNPAKKKTVLLVAHGVVNRMIISYFTGIHHKKTRQFWQEFTCINKIYWESHYKNWRVGMINNDSHIPKRLK